MAPVEFGHYTGSGQLFEESHLPPDFHKKVNFGPARLRVYSGNIGTLKSSGNTFGLDFVKYQGPDDTKGKIMMSWSYITFSGDEQVVIRSAKTGE